MTAGEEALLKACLVLDGDAFECWYQIRGASADGDLEYKQVLAEANAWARGIDEGDAQGHAIRDTPPASTSATGPCSNCRSRP